jgi:hypothetical protein
MKHAFLIIAHNEPLILDVLMKKLSLNNDCDTFVYLDKKIKDSLLKQLKNIVKARKGILVPNTKRIFWGDYSQIKSEMSLYQLAIQYNYDYYHLLSGVDLPIKPMDEFLDFIENHNKEFINIDKGEDALRLTYERVNYYHYLMHYEKDNGILGKSKRLIFNKFGIPFQKAFNISRLKNDNIKFYKGANWCSLSRQAVQYLISKRKYIRLRFHYTYCCDEIYKQTILMNSSFSNRLFIPQINALTPNLREIDWNHGNPYTWEIKDKKILKNSENFFARKFSTKTENQLAIVKYIDSNIH